MVNISKKQLKKWSDRIGYLNDITQRLDTLRIKKADRDCVEFIQKETEKLWGEIKEKL